MADVTPGRGILAGRDPELAMLAPLGEAAVKEILQTAGVGADPDMARFVHDPSEGNPLYVTTPARVLAAQPGIAPDTDTVARIAGGSAEISHLVSSLSDGLDDGARDLLAAASVLGTEFGSELAASVSGAGQDVLAAPTAAEAAGLAIRRPRSSYSIRRWCDRCGWPRPSRHSWPWPVHRSKASRQTRPANSCWLPLDLRFPRR